MEGDLLAFKPGLSWTGQVCSIVMNRRVHLCLLVFNLLFSEQRSTEPSHSRAGLTSIGLEIKRTPLSNQTSPRRAPSHSFKTSKRSWNWHFQSPTAETEVSKRVLLLLYSVWKAQFRPTVRRGGPATTRAPSAPRGKQPITRLPPVFQSAPKCAKQPSSVEMSWTNKWKHYHMTAITSKAAVNPCG